MLPRRFPAAPRRAITSPTVFNPSKRVPTASWCATAALQLPYSMTGEPPVGPSSRSPPTLTLLGGGSASGKSTVLSSLSGIQHVRCGAPSSGPVIVNADLFKRHDPAYVGRLSSVCEVHKRSTEYAEQLLVSAVNQGRDIVFDGTMAWEPFVRQTIQMVRSARQFRFKRGPGYVPEVHSKPGAPEETYWETDGPQPELVQQLPAYRIRLIGVTVEPTVGVLRAILRQLASGRSVPVGAQLRSYRLFSSHFEGYAKLVDDAILFDNNPLPSDPLSFRPSPCAWKSRPQAPLQVVDRRAWERFLSYRHLECDSAACNLELVTPTLNVKRLPFRSVDARQ